MSKEPKKITRNGMEVWCYGEWKSDSNALIICQNAQGYAFEEVDPNGASNWTEIVERWTAWAKRMGYTVEEMSAV